MGNAAHVDVHPPRGPLASRRLLRLAGDDRLVAQIRRGSDAAFEVAFERHSPGILAFCRHMLGSREEAEDAVQHTFAAAYRNLQGGDDREIVLKPWLFTIARNRCLSLLRARHEVPQSNTEVATAGLAEQVEQRAELRELLADIHELPDEQRAALLLAEVGGLAQVDIASVLGCETARVKALVYRARSGLIARRDARELPCEQVREQLAELRGGSLRRTELQLHLRECPGCRAFRAEVKRQRQMLAVALPVAPTLGLKSSVLGAVGIGGGAAAAGGVAAGGAAVGGGAALAGVAKVAAVAVIAASGTAVVVHEREPGPSPGANGGGHEVSAPAAGQTPAAAEPDAAGGATVAKPRDERPPKGVGRVMGRDEPKKRPTHQAESAPGQLKARGEPARPVKPEQAAEKGGNGRGPIEAPPKDTPVRRGPPEPKLKEQAAPKVQAAPRKPDKVEKRGPELE